MAKEKRKDKKPRSPAAACAIRCTAFLALSLLGKFELRYWFANVGEIGCILYEIFLTTFFLQVVDRNKRSFFAKGRGIENITRGLLWGIVLPLYPALMDFGFKKLTFIRDYSQKLFGVGSVHILCEAVFTAFLAFGYVFTVIKEHYGEKPAGVFSILIYLVYTEIRLYDFIDPVLREGWPVNPFEFINFLSLLLVGIGCVLMLMAYGDIRSVAIFLPLMYLIQYTGVTYYDIYHSGVFLDSGFRLMRTLPFFVSDVAVCLMILTRVQGDGTIANLVKDEE